MKAPNRPMSRQGGTRGSEKHSHSQKPFAQAVPRWYRRVVRLRWHQTLTRWETLWLATAGNKWFIREDEVGSIEAGNHANLVVLDRDYFTVPDEDFTRTRSLLTVVGGKVVHNDGVLELQQDVF